MAKSKRRFNANPPAGEMRCEATTYFHGEGGRCMRRAKVGSLCRQHAAVAARAAHREGRS